MHVLLLLIRSFSQEEWGRPAGLFQSFWGTAVRILSWHLQNHPFLPSGTVRIRLLLFLLLLVFRIVIKQVNKSVIAMLVSDAGSSFGNGCMYAPGPNYTAFWLVENATRHRATNGFASPHFLTNSRAFFLFVHLIFSPMLLHSAGVLLLMPCYKSDDYQSYSTSSVCRIVF